MKIIFAGPEPFDIHLLKGANILLSFYDIAVSKIPFRKETWKLITKGGDDDRTKSE